jgi:hypothetical protein
VVNIQHTESSSLSMSADLETRNDFRKIVYDFAIHVGQVLQAVAQTIEATADRAELDYRRAQLLEAYKRRRDWKKGDIRRLNSLGVNSAARRQMERLEYLGRPVVKAHQDLETVIVEKLRPMLILFAADSTSVERKKAFRRLPWWPHYVEALHRGEYALAKAKSVRGPSSHAEFEVGKALGISSATVHTIRVRIRRMRREWDGSANFPPMTLYQFEDWMRTGKKPEWLSGGA